MIVTDTGSQSNVIKYNIINLPKWDIAQSGVSKSDQGKKVFRLSHIWLPNPVFFENFNKHLNLHWSEQTIHTGDAAAHPGEVLYIYRLGLRSIENDECGGIC